MDFNDMPMTPIPLPQLPKFKGSKYRCVPTMDGPNCKRCRSPVMGDWREEQTGEREFPCPFAKDEAVETRLPAVVSMTNAAAFLRVWTTGEMVSDEVAEQRKAICAGCEYCKASDAGKYCAAPGGCGCTVEPRKVAFLTVGMADITRWDEKPGKRLCAHPKRGKMAGCGWPM